MSDDKTLHARGKQYASEHTGHGIVGVTDPLIQETGSDRALATAQVDAWAAGRNPGTHRLVSRDMVTYVSRWAPVDADLEGSTDGR